VLWLDAHADFNPSQVTPSGNIHGMPVACLCGLGPRELTHLGGDAPALRPDEIRQIGIRSVDEGEKRLVQEYGLDVYDMRYIDEVGMKRTMEAALQETSDRLGTAEFQFFVLSRRFDHVEQILVKNNRNFIKSRGERISLGFLGNGLLTSEGSFWRRQRRATATVTTQQNVASRARTGLLWLVRAKTHTTLFPGLASSQPSLPPSQPTHIRSSSYPPPMQQAVFSDRDRDPGKLARTSCRMSYSDETPQQS
jgi:hypothetical protein